MKTILITGGAGFIGSNFIKYILNNYVNYRVINYDCLTYAGNLDNLKEVENNLNYKFVKGNITDYDKLQLIMKKYNISIIINYAAETHVDRSIENSRKFIETNVLGTGTLLEIGRLYNIEKFIQISTDEVYGSLNGEGYFIESDKVSANNPYSASKASGDLIALSYFKTYGFPIIVTRCCNNYGSNQHPEKLIPLMITKAIKNEKLPVYGDGSNIREWIHVLDHCRAIDLILHRGTVGEIYNIGTGIEKSNITIVKHILKILNKDESLIEFANDRLGHDFRYALNSNKIKNLGFNPQISFQSGLNDTIKYYLKNTENTGDAMSLS